MPDLTIPLTAVVKAKSVYGETKFYPVNEIARGFADVAGTKTLTPETLRIMKRMGVALTLDADATLETMRI
jgi:hypothetical protein